VLTVVDSSIDSALHTDSIEYRSLLEVHNACQHVMQ
jgi:hypothetical protein